MFIEGRDASRGDGQFGIPKQRTVALANRIVGGRIFRLTTHTLTENGRNTTDVVTQKAGFTTVVSRRRTVAPEFSAQICAFAAFALASHTLRLLQATDRLSIKYAQFRRKDSIKRTGKVQLNSIGESQDRLFGNQNDVRVAQPDLI